MTSLDPMSRDELLDLAPLDVFGQLDEYEAALFTRSFHHAPASVQAEIRALQAELAEDSAFLSREAPRPLLRSKVLLRVQEEIEETAEQLQPIAQIGGLAGAQAGGQSIIAAAAGSSAGFAGVPSRLVGGGSTLADGLPSSDEAMRELVAEIRARAASVVMRERATPYWRAAAFILAAGLFVSFYVLARTMRTAEAIAQLAQNQVINGQLADLVPSLADFAYRDSQIRGLSSADTSVNGTATLYVDIQHGRAFLLALGLSSSKGPFTLRSVDERGNATVITTFKASDPVFGMVADKLPADILSCKLELLDGDGRIILRTA